MTDVENMSPEQIAELQKQNCIFCHIVSGKVSSKKIFDDEKSLAVLDINPANPGHLLLLPKEHYTIMALMPEDVVSHLGMVAKQLSRAALRALKVQGTNIFIANGAVAGQKAPHFMVHIIPRKEGDSIAALSIPEKRLDEAEMESVRQRILAKVGQFLPKNAVTEAEESVASSSPPVSPPPDPAPAPKADLDAVTELLAGAPAESVVPASNFVASKESKKYHFSQCPLAKKIKPENKITFNSEEEAKSNGYERCDCLK